MQKLVVILFLLAFVSRGQDLENFDRLYSKGPIPEDFTTLSSERFEADFNSNENKRLDKEFFLSTRFYISELLQSSKILFNEPLSIYVNDVAEFLLKDKKDLLDKLSFYVIKTNAVNAFSTDMGIIVVTTGFLAHMESEAQLAYVLAHEIAHYTQKHSRNGYIEYKDYEKSRGRYRRLSTYSAVNRISQYNKDQELEADKIGMELFLQTAYDPNEIKNSFLMLYHGDLPFGNEELDEDFLGTEKMIIPTSFYPDSIGAIDQNINYDDSESTHPNMKKRIDAYYNHIKENPANGTKKFLVSEKEFYRVRNLARFESINLDLGERYYGDALYSIYLLSKEYKTNRFLDLSKVKALYGLAKYKNHRRYDEVSFRLRHVQGESYKLHGILDKLNQKQLNVVVMRHLYDMKEKYVKDQEFENYFNDFKAEFALRSNIDFIELKDERYNPSVGDGPNISFDIADSLKKIDNTEGLSRMDKIKLKKELNLLQKENYIESAENNFHLFGLHDLVSNNAFINDIQSLKSKLELEEAQEDSINLKLEKKIKKNGYRLGKNDLVVIDPIYESYRLNKKKDFVNSELKGLEISELYTKGYKKLDLNINVLDSKNIGQDDVDEYNDISLLKDWMSEVLDHDDIEMISSNHHKMQRLREKYNTDVFLFSGIYKYKELKEASSKHLGAMIFIVTIPLIAADLLIVHNQFDLVSIVLDAKNDRVQFVDLQSVNFKGTNKVLRAYMYNVLYQVNKEW